MLGTGFTERATNGFSIQTLKVTNLDSILSLRSNPYRLRKCDAGCMYSTDYIRAQRRCSVPAYVCPSELRDAWRFQPTRRRGRCNVAKYGMGGRPSCLGCRAEMGTRRILESPQERPRLWFRRSTCNLSTRFVCMYRRGILTPKRHAYHSVLCWLSSTGIALVKAAESGARHRSTLHRRLTLRKLFCLLHRFFSSTDNCMSGVIRMHKSMDVHAVAWSKEDTPHQLELRAAFFC